MRQWVVVLPKFSFCISPRNVGVATVDEDAVKQSVVPVPTKMYNLMHSQVIKLCDLANDSDSVTSVQWTDKGDFLAVGTNKGITQVSKGIR